MTKFLRLTAVAATAAMAFTATEAAAVPADTDATATARILVPLQLKSKQNLDLGTIILSGAGVYTATVGIGQTGTFSCASPNVTCSDPHQNAVYTVTGTAGATVAIDADDVTMNGPGTATLTLTPDVPATVALTGVGGDDFGVGGSITVANDTPDGVYTGTFAVTADYQ